MPLSGGLSSTAFLFAGSSGANRRGRTGCAIVLADRVIRKERRADRLLAEALDAKLK